MEDSVAQAKGYMFHFHHRGTADSGRGVSSGAAWSSSLPS